MLILLHCWLGSGIIRAIFNSLKLFGKQMKKIKCAVIGVGYLGKFHAEKYMNAEQAELIAVCDTNPDSCREIADKHGVKAVFDYREILDQVDAVSIVVPTIYHYQIAKDCLNKGIHVLLEKPMTKTTEQAKELIECSKKTEAKLQIGHIERFNSARLALDTVLNNPRFIESHRLAAFNPRATDVNVILDLMIHDIDLIQSMVKSPIQTIDAQGAPILSKYIDIANARITFVNGCVANVTASRISFKSERKTRIFQPDSYISIDYQNKKFAVFKKGDGEMFPGIPNITSQESVFDNTDALQAEIDHFISCIIENKTPLVTAQDGYEALMTATRISQLIKDNLLNVHEIA